MKLYNTYIGLDRDGTLEMPGYPVPEELIVELRELQQRGAKLFVASGKSYDALLEIFRGLSLSLWMYCCENGGHIVIPSENYSYIASGTSDLRYFVNIASQLDLPPYQDEPKVSIWSYKFGENALRASQIIKNFINEKNLKLQVFVHPDIDGGLDIVPEGIDKVNLLPHIPTSATIYYFGDGENDLKIMSHERVKPNTFLNGKAVIKECVKGKNGYISLSPAGEGVLDGLEFILKE